MAKTLGVIEVQGAQPTRVGGTFPGIVAGRKFGGCSLLEWVVRRVTDSLLLDELVVVSDRDARGRPLAELTPPHVSIFYSTEPDPLARLAAAVRQYDADNVVRVCVGNPFVDPGLIDRLITTARTNPGCDYVSYCSADGRPAVLSSLGLFAEWIRADAIHYTNRDAKSQTDRQSVTSYIYSHPELFQLRLIPLPERLDRDDVRLAIESEEDWDHAQTIYEALGPERLDWQHIAGLLDHQPALRQRMAVMNRTSIA